MGKPLTPLDERFDAKVDKSAGPSGCWPFQGEITHRGYGQINRGGRGSPRVKAHRYAWERERGDIPDGMFVCHRCDNPPCCNPAHLFLGTSRDNIDDMVGKGRQRRGQGHGRAVYSTSEVETVRKLSAQGLTDRQVSALTGMSRGYVWKVVARENRGVS